MNIFISIYENSAKRFAENRANIAQRRIVLRDAILSSYPSLETGNAVFRLHIDGDDFLNLAKVDLATGDRTNTILTPHYRDYGLSSKLGVDAKTVFFQGVGFQSEYASDPAALEKFNISVMSSYPIASPLE